MELEKIILGPVKLLTHLMSKNIHVYLVIYFLNFSCRGEVLVKFKKATLEGKGIPGGMIAVSGSYLAYLVNERKVRIFNLETGQKCSIDRTVGVFVGLAWSDARGQPGETCLAVLAEDGEVTIGKISSESGEELSFEVFLILSFPEIGRARAISWNSGGPIL